MVKELGSVMTVIQLYDKLGLEEFWMEMKMGELGGPKPHHVYHWLIMQETVHV